MILSKIQQDFENVVTTLRDNELDLEKFGDGARWGSEDLTNCYCDGFTEGCFSFYKIGLKSKDRLFFENNIETASGYMDSKDLDRDGDGYADPFVDFLWNYFNLSTNTDEYSLLSDEECFQ